MDPITLIPGASIQTSPPRDRRIPQFEILPPVPRPKWGKPALVAECEELEGVRQALHQMRKRFTDELEARLSADPVTLAITAPGTRQKKEIEILRAERSFRGQLRQLALKVLDEHKDEEVRLAEARTSASNEAMTRLKEVFASLDVPTQLWVEHIHKMAEGSRAVRQAAMAVSRDDAEKASWKGLSQRDVWPHIEKRIAELTAELVDMN